jgi:maltose alpha-D-glucosyltransferase/alpha-amylase
MAKRQKNRFDPDPLWYRDAVIYQLHVKSFFDANNDGVGDFPGLLAKLDYLCELASTRSGCCRFISPWRDDGYTSVDYKTFIRSMAAWVTRRLVFEAHERGIRVITELVVNHTRPPSVVSESQTRQARLGSARFLRLSDDDVYAGTRIIFPDTEKPNWAWDDVAKPITGIVSIAPTRFGISTSAC